MLEVLGTLGAGGGGLAGLYLLARGVWKMWSGQIREQRLMMEDAREERSDILAERESLRNRLNEANERCAELEKVLRDNNEHLRQQLNECHKKRRQWSEYSSQLRRDLIESGVSVKDLPPFPKEREISRNDGVD